MRIAAELRERFRALFRRGRLSQSELIRQAINSLLAPGEVFDRAALLQQARDLWSGRDDLPDFGALRREPDRGLLDAD